MGAKRCSWDVGSGLLAQLTDLFDFIIFLEMYFIVCFSSERASTGDSRPYNQESSI